MQLKLNTTELLKYLYDRVTLSQSGRKRTFFINAKQLNVFILCFLDNLWSHICAPHP